MAESSAISAFSLGGRARRRHRSEMPRKSVSRIFITARRRAAGVSISRQKIRIASVMADVNRALQRRIVLHGAVGPAHHQRINRAVGECEPHMNGGVVFRRLGFGEEAAESD